MHWSSKSRINRITARPKPRLDCVIMWQYFVSLTTWLHDDYFPKGHSIQSGKELPIHHRHYSVRLPTILQISMCSVCVWERDSERQKKRNREHWCIWEHETVRVRQWCTFYVERWHIGKPLCGWKLWESTVQKKILRETKGSLTAVEIIILMLGGRLSESNSV